MVFHACLHDTPIVVSKDTDFLVLLIHTLTIEQPAQDSFMKVNHKRFVNVRAIVKQVVLSLPLYLPHSHALTGCDTTFHFYNIRKVKVMQKLIKDQKHLKKLTAIDKNKLLSEDDIAVIAKFVQVSFYNAKKLKIMKRPGTDYTKI